MNAIIIDDEEDARLTLRNFIRKYLNDVHISAEADSVQSGIEQIQIHEPDLIFLDILMGDGTGFELLEKINYQNLNIIFTTAFDDYAIQAFKYSAIDYLLKPIDPNELIQAIERIVSIGYKSETQEKLRMIADLFSQQEIRKIGIPVKDTVLMVDTKDILRCESQSNYTLIVLQNGDQYIVARTLKEYDVILTGLGQDFFRVHKSHLININHIKKYFRGDGGNILMKDGTLIPVSRRRKDQLFKRIII